MDDDYDEIMKRLDFKYGRPDKLVDVVLTKLKGLRKIGDNGYRRFMEMVDIIERSFLDLKKLDLQGEMNTTSMLGEYHLLGYMNGVLLKQTYKPGEPQFEVFLKYLRLQRNAMEYEEKEFRQLPMKARVNAVTENAEAQKDNSIQKQLEEIVMGLANVANIVSRNGGESNGCKETSGNKCFLGSDKHDVRECTGFESLSLNERFEMAKEKSASFSLRDICLVIAQINKDARPLILLPREYVTDSSYTVAPK